MTALRRLVVVPVHANDMPAEGAPLFIQRLQGEGLFHRGQGLNLVKVDGYDEVIQLVLMGDERAFPDGALVAFAVADDAVHAVLFVIELCGHRHTHGHGHALTQ